MNESPSKSTGAGAHIGVIVVHGVGEVVPGEVTTALVDTLDKDASVDADPRFEVKYLPDTGAPDFVANSTGGSSQNGSPTFPAQFRVARLKTGEKLTFAELYWADLTQIGSGRVNTLFGIFRVIFEAHFLIDAMLDRRGGFLARWLRFVLLGLSYLLRGPLAALTLCAIAIFWVAINIKPDGGFLFFGPADPATVVAAVIGVVMIASLTVLVHTSRGHDYTWRTTAMWAVIASAAVLFLYALPVNIYWSDTKNVTAAQLLVSSYDGVINLWRAWGICFLLFALPLLIAIAISTLVQVTQMRERRSGFASAATATGILALQFLLWTAIAGTVIMPLLSSAERIVALSVIDKAIDEDSRLGQFRALAKSERPSKFDATRTEAQIIVKLEVATLELDVPKFLTSRFDFIDRFKFAYGANGIIIMTFVVMFAMVGIVRSLVAFTYGRRYALAARAMPRLLFSAIVIVPLLFLVSFHILFNIILSEVSQEVAEAASHGSLLKDCDFKGLSNLLGLVHDSAMCATGFGLNSLAQGLNSVGLGLLIGYGTGEEAVAKFIVLYKYSIVGSAALFAILLPLLLGHRLHNGLHIARDLIDHQYGSHEGKAFATAALRNVDPDRRVPRRAHIQKRLLTLLNAIASKEKLDGIVLVSHSQGSVLVYDYLRKAAPEFRELNGVNPTIVTCGSPLTHIYRRYFHEYADLQSELERLRPLHRGWSNAYRIDDYIGTHIGNRKSDAVRNEAMPKGGHADYWKEGPFAQMVLEAIRRSKTQLVTT